jgi:hypothetical protein
VFKVLCETFICMIIITNMATMRYLIVVSGKINVIGNRTSVNTR